MTPTSYLGHQLPKMTPEQRRWRLRLIMGEMIVALPDPAHNDPGCMDGPAWSKRELDGMAHLVWKLGRADANGRFFGGPQDGVQP